VQLQGLKTRAQSVLANKRIRLVLMGAGANAISTVLSFTVFFISVPLTISYLGPERFGLWMTVASIAGMLSFMDFGVGNGLVSQVARNNTGQRAQALQHTISNGLIILTLIGLLVAALLSMAYLLVPVDNVLNISSPRAITEADTLFKVFIFFFCLNIPLNGMFKILLGLQMNWLAHAIKSTASIVSLIAIILLARSEAPPAQLLMATYGVQVTSTLLLVPWFFRTQLLSWACLIDWQSLRNEYRVFLNVGGLFLILQLGMMAGWGADALIISSLADVAAVAQYAVIHRLYQFVSVPVTIINTPLWGAYADAHAQGDIAFIRNTLKTSLALTFLVSASLSLILYFASDWILSVWTEDAIEVSGALILGFTIWKVLESVGNSLSMALNGLHVIKPQVVSVLLLCLMVLPLKFYFTPTYGAVAVIWSTVVAYFLSTLLFYLIYFRKQIAQELFTA